MTAGWDMPLILAAAAAMAAVLAMILSLACLVRLGGISLHDLQTREAARIETDFMLRAGEEQAFALRQELRESIAELRHGTLASFSGLREEFGAMARRLQAGMSESMTLASGQQKERLDATRAALEAFGEKLEKTQETLRGAVEGRLDAIRQENAAKLEEMRKTVDEKLQTTLETRLGESFTRVVEHLNKVAEGIGEMRSLAANVGDLRNVLTNVKVRGIFGEVQLAMLLDDLLTPDQFIRDARVREHGGERVEFAVRMPREEDDAETLLPIDAKFPREDYERLQQAAADGDTRLVTHFQKELEKRIRISARDISEKYINPPVTTDWAVLFLPTEGLYAEVLRQPGLVDALLREYRVWVAGPTTLGAILNAFRAVYRSIAIERRSGEVWRLLGAIRTEFERYNEVVSRIERQLGTAANTVTSLHQRTRVMSRKLKGVEALPDAGEAMRLLEIQGPPVEDEEEDEAAEPAGLQGNVVPLTS
ncbi:MAG: DNA recombination protein RmuC [Parvibaculaceae bacterium]